MRATPGELKPMERTTWEPHPLHEVSLQGALHPWFTGEYSRTLIHPPTCAYAAHESDMAPTCGFIHQISSQSLGVEIGYL